MDLVKQAREFTSDDKAKIRKALEVTSSELMSRARLELARDTQSTATPALNSIADVRQQLRQIAQQLGDNDVPELLKKTSRLPLRTQHSYISIVDGKFEIELGKSPATSVLRGDIAVILPTGLVEVHHRQSQDDLPKLVVTVLGPTGSGKTALLLSMYDRLRNGVGAFNLTSTDPNTDTALGAAQKELWGGQFPDGTDKSEIIYEFDLLHNNAPISRIDWIDYRGGMLLDDSSLGTDQLIERIKSSDVIIWMIDIASIRERHPSLGHNTNKSREVTNLGRLRFLTSSAALDKLSSIIFVCSKCDRVADYHPDVQGDLDKVAQQTQEHLGDAIHALRAGAHGQARTGFIVAASSGVVRQTRPTTTPTAPKISGKAVPVVVTPVTTSTITVEDNINCEWPILLGLEPVIRNEVSKLRMMQRDLQAKNWQVLPWWKRLFVNRDRHQSGIDVLLRDVNLALHGLDSAVSEISAMQNKQTKGILSLQARKTS